MAGNMKVTDMRSYTSNESKPLGRMEMWIDIPYSFDLSRRMSAWVEMDKTDEDDPIRSVEFYVGATDYNHPPYTHSDYELGSGFLNLETEEPDPYDRKALVLWDVNDPTKRHYLDDIRKEVEKLAVESMDKPYVMEASEFYQYRKYNQVDADDYPLSCNSYYDYLKGMIHVPDVVNVEKAHKEIYRMDMEELSRDIQQQPEADDQYGN